MPAPMPRTGFTIARITAQAFRVPVAKPVATSFGIMRNRPAVFVRIEDGDGCFGWGEAFANWPAAGAEHRVNLLIDDVADLVLGKTWTSPGHMFNVLGAATHIRAIQCGEPGPFAQAIASLDIAAWDLVSRRAGVSLARMLNAQAALDVPAYASGIHIDHAPAEIARARTVGFRAFKVKLGFDPDSEPDKILSLAQNLTGGERLMADANQGWSMSEASRFLAHDSARTLGWIEEPIPVDASLADWQRLASYGVPLAGGENIAGMPDFVTALDADILSVIQPDVAKWGGITGCLAVARQARDAGKVYCPHFLGGGIGLTASAHVLAAFGGNGLLKVDLNPSPLRDAMCDLQSSVSSGTLKISSAPGLGVEALADDVLARETLSRTASV